jgi:rSAM/selenodomain-associated transferase 2
MEDAFCALETSDCVIGPASDGGYYLIGLRSVETPPPGSWTSATLFQNIDWGSEHVFEQTMKAASGLSVHQLPMLHDVDFPEDIPLRISVIIPTLNEEYHLLQNIGKARQGFDIEVIVADGGSGDRTLEQSVGARVVKSPRGRGAQQNAGAKVATGDLLLFLHADTMLPERWDWIVRKTLADPAVALGAFTFKIKEQLRGMEFIEKTANKRSKDWKLPYGDQGLFMRRKIFKQVGGFPNFPIMEDYALVRAASALGEIVTVPEAAITSGRRWKEHGVFKVTVANKLMILGYHLGIPPQKLARFYRGKR